MPERSDKRVHLSEVLGRKSEGPWLAAAPVLASPRCQDQTYRAASCSGCERQTSPPDDSSSGVRLAPKGHPGRTGTLAAAGQRRLPTISSSRGVEQPGDSSGGECNSGCLAASPGWRRLRQTVPSGCSAKGVGGAAGWSDLRAAVVRVPRSEAGVGRMRKGRRTVVSLSLPRAERPADLP